MVLVTILAAGLVGWYWFRPERAFIDRRVSESFPAVDSARETVVAQGSFHSNAHPTRGAATVHRLANGHHLLRLTDFRTLNGPDVRIYLVAADDVTTGDEVKGGFVDLGALKGNVGDQNYELPAGIDLTKYRAVSVWCRRFSVNFGAAPLAAPTEIT